MTVVWTQKSSANTPSISADNISILYNAEEGEIEYSITNPVEGGSIAASTTSDWLEVDENAQTTTSGAIEFICDANPNYLARTATVTLTYTYNTDQTITKNVTVTQASNPTGVGSQTNPLTVAQARTLIDGLNGGTSGEVYVTGIVSEIVTEYSTQYNNITFNMVDNSGDTDFLQAYRCTGTDAANVIVNDVAIVKGQLKLYSGTYEFNTGCQLVSLTHPATPYITADDVTIACDATSGSIIYTVNNPVNGGELTATTTAAWLTIGTVGATVPFTCTANSETTSRTATVTLTYTYNRTTVTKDVTVTQAAYEAPHVTWDLSTDQTATATEDEMTWTSDFATMAVEKANATTNTNNYYPGTQGQSYTSTRFYKNSVLTVAPVVGYVITSVVFDATTNGYASALQSSTWTNATATVNEDIVTVTPTDGTNAISAVIGATCGFTSVTVYYVVNNNPAISAEPVSIAFDATSGSITYTITNGVQGGAVSATTDAEWLTIGTVGANVPFTCTANSEITDRTATVTLTYTYNRATATTSVTVTQDGDPNGQGSQTNPYTVAQALAFTSYPANGICVHGIVSTAPTSLNNGMLTYYISDNGEDENELEVYKGKDLENVDFTAVNNIQVGDIVTVYGDVIIYNDIKEFASGNYLVSFERPALPSITVSPATVNLTSEQTGAFLTVAYENLADEPDFDVLFVDANGEVAEYDWLGYSYDDIESIEIQAQANEGEARTAYVMVIGYDNEANMVQSNIVTVNQAAYVAPFEPATYTLVTSTSLVSGKTYIIVGENDGDYYAMGEQRSSNRGGVAISVNGTTATVETADVHEFVITALDGDDAGYYSIEDGGYLYAASSGANQLKTEATLSDNGKWIIEINNGVFSIVANKSTNRNVMRFNYNNGSPIFACYATATQSPVRLYVKDETPVTETYTLTITGYTDVTEGTNNKGYYLIASPVTVDPATVEGMTTGDFDLYYFDDSQDDEWINYKADDNGAINNFNLVPGKGYLYAKKATAETPSYSFNLTGAPYTGTGEIPVAAGWNLIGNPFAVAATPDMPYYRMNADGSGLNATTESGAVNAMEGVFVNATAAGNVTFSTGTSKGQNIALNVMKGRGTTIDRAIVRFDEGQQLPKFQLFENSTKLYIPQGNKDFAIVRSAAEGEMPVNFRASENGTYTLSIETENVEMNYLHLIDNMTGADVDLLATPNYTFEARTNDYSSRFRLVFSAEENGASTDSATFAYYNGTSWTVSNTGDATLQVVDITGRIVSSETINGNATVSLNQPAGIYMLRLVNGNDVKVQKVVVR